MGRNSPGICKEGELGLGQILTSLPPLVQEGAAASLVTGGGASGSFSAEESGSVWTCEPGLDEDVFASVGGERV